nr:acyl carrier protein [Candidatus Enterousia merdequi]
MSLSIPRKRVILKAVIDMIKTYRHAEHVQDITPNTELKTELGLTSLDLAEIISIFENKHKMDIDIPFNSINTIDDLANGIHKAIVQKYQQINKKTLFQNAVAYRKAHPIQPKAFVYRTLTSEKGVLSKVIKTIHEKAILREPVNITIDTNLRDDLDLATLDIAEICMALESFYKINLNDILIENLRTVKDLVNTVFTRTHTEKQTLQQTVLATISNQR